MKKKFLVAVCALALMASTIFMSGCSSNECEVELTLPPSYGFSINTISEEVFVAHKNKITVELESGSPDGAVLLVDADVSDKSYPTEEKYITPGISVSFNVDKGESYRLLFKAGNATAEDMVATFIVHDVKVDSI